VWGEESVDEDGPVLDALEPVAGDRQEMVDAVDGEVADAAFEVRPHDAGGHLPARAGSRSAPPPKASGGRQPRRCSTSAGAAAGKLGVM
jgi:hypothetical protein